MVEDTSRRGFLKSVGSLGVIALGSLGTITGVLLACQPKLKVKFPTPEAVSISPVGTCIDGDCKLGGAKCVTGTCTKGTGTCNKGSFHK